MNRKKPAEMVRLLDPDYSIRYRLLSVFEYVSFGVFLYGCWKIWTLTP